MRWLSVYNLTYNDAIKLRLKDSYSLHKTVYSLFPEEVNKGARILYADRGFRNGIRKILVLSAHEPESGDIGSIQTKRVPECLLEFESYNFEIIINPVRRINSTGKLEPVRKRDEICAWFRERARNWGFECWHVETGPVWVDSFFKAPHMPVTLSKARITGSLAVRERDRFRRSFRDGLGRGRAFGCGLLQLEPVINA